MLNFWKMWTLTGILTELAAIALKRVTLSQTYEHLMRTLPRPAGFVLSSVTFSLTTWLIPHWAFKDRRADNDAFALITGALLGAWAYSQRD